MPRGDHSNPTALTAIRRLRLLGPVAALALFAVAVYLSGRLGVEMARNRLPDRELNGSRMRSEETLIVGESDDPLYLARAPDSLRRFFSAHPTPEERSGADLSGLGIRRIRDSIKVATLRLEADAVEVRVTSGALAGTVHWIHHSQFRAIASLDPLVSPVPQEGRR